MVEKYLGKGKKVLKNGGEKTIIYFNMLFA